MTSGRRAVAPAAGRRAALQAAGRRAALLAAGPLIAGCASGGPAAGGPASAPADFEPLLRSTHRRPANVARDGARNPAKTLAFFAVRSDSRVVEILPGSAGYYLEILAPFLRARGLYVAASRPADALPAYVADHQRLLERLRAEPALYDRVQVTAFDGDRHPIAADGSADFVLTFRNLHNWIERGQLDAALRAFHRALRPGGVLGVVDHRARTDQPAAEQLRLGYVREDFAVAAIEAAGFRLDARSEVNANPRDTRDHPEGVWTLPPTLRLKDRDRERYLAIGESDRFTLRFVRR
jgi:predicted methyltransferase